MKGRVRKLPAWAVVLLLIGSVFLVTGIPYAIGAGSAQSPDWEQVRTPLTLPNGMSAGQLDDAVVYKIVDGDTIEVLLDGVLETVRYYGVDTPERGTECFRDATERNRRLVGSKVRLLPGERDRDSFARLLRYVFLSDGTSVDATLVAEGFGLAWRDDGQYREQIIALEGEARANGRGCLWRESD
jgi:micrococcal nuclease